ncbi:MAG: hypothetical protein LRZ98_00470 [Candidatus Pacebacteria bacterium]|nr:hypothetical protein [Candidatus Paceibacterota bacterium]
MEGTLDGNRKRARESCEEFIFDNPKFNFMKMHCTLLTADKREEFIQKTSGNRPFLIQQLMGKEGSNQFIVFYKILETFEVEFGKAPGSFDQCQKFVDEVLRPALLNSENVKYVYTHEDEVCREFRNKTIFLRYRALEEVNRENYPPL